MKCSVLNRMTQLGKPEAARGVINDLRRRYAVMFRIMQQRRNSNVPLHTIFPFLLQHPS